MNKPTLIVMVGIPASGKTDRTKPLSELFGAKVFSSDAYRKQLLGNENSQKNNKLVFTTLYNDIEKELVKGNNCILDSTNTTRKNRKLVVDRFSKYADIVAYVMATDVDVCIKRDANRTRQVGKDVINKFVLSYQFPQMFEGFSNIIIDNVDRKSYSENNVKTIRNRMNRFNQQNPHHKYTVGTHCDKLAEQFNELDIRNLAGKWHDVGKLFTQVVDDNGVGHYYGHESYSAYYMLSHLDLVDLRSNYLIGEFLFYINYHMHIRDIVNNGKETTKQKYRDLFGTDYSGASRYDKLIEFMQADNDAGHK